MCCRPPIWIATEEDFHRHFPNEAACEHALFDHKWRGGWFCPRCGNRTMSPNKRKQYQCSKCGYAPSARVGTIFENGKLALLTMFKMIFYLCLSPVGISAKELSRRLDIGYEAALNNSHKIRDAMADPLTAVPLVDPIARSEISLSGVINPAPFRELPGDDNPLVEIYGEMSIESIPSVDADPVELFGPELVSELGHEPVAEREPESEERAELERLMMVVAGTEDYAEILARAQEPEEGDEALWVTGIKLRYWFSDIFKNAVGCHLPKYLVEYGWRFNYRHRRPQLFEQVLGAMVAHPPLTYHELVHGEKSPFARRRARLAAAL